MSQVIANVAEDTTAEDCRSGVPAVEEDSVGQFPERNRENDEQCWRHHESELVHWEIVVDAVEEEVERDEHTIVR